MTVNLIKLCVGADSVEDLTGWIAERLADKQRRGVPAEQVHVTRMTPKRQDDILDGGSLYWVIKGIIQCRQRILELRPVTGEDGVARCGIVLDPDVRLVEPRPRGAFQGWRYLDAKDAPPDLGDKTSGIADMPAAMRRELVELGLL
ncbi:DUF1489 family protein [Microbaculum marinisediminis]|uniref:DUF1489 domain-containing protein n=1 Tax=Microbaculum marinisediminis TaxID=2931392 RepID=A0AAW5R3D0_9HYPH|nr:DUF1489 domain-containing protein [Microbaculum sp. A6E488]MCT8973153.1 DUF1489 domain-containing protein [Microbaculum sp. A6E488]